MCDIISCNLHTVTRNKLVGLASKFQRDRKYMSGTTFYFCQVIDRRLNVNNGLKFDANLFFENISSLARRRQGNNTIWIAAESDP